MRRGGTVADGLRTAAVAPGWVRAGAGAVVWLAGLLATWPSPFDVAWAKALLLLGALVVVPLGLDLVAADATDGWPRRLWLLAAGLQLPTAVLLGAAYI